MLESILPYGSAPVAELQQPPVPACEVWFVEDLDDAWARPACVLPDAAIQSPPDMHE